VAAGSIPESVKEAEKYCRDIIAGRIPACKWTRLACERHFNDKKRQKDKDWPYRFDPVYGDKAVRFIERLPHVKGKWAAKAERLKLEPWQKFLIVSVFGWRRKTDGGLRGFRTDFGLRRFRKVYWRIPRKNAKSTKAAGIGLYMLCADGEFGAEVYAGATTERQAWEVFRPAKLMVERTKALQQALSLKVNASNLHILRNGSRFEPIVGKPGDGSSPSCSIHDEYHEHQSNEQVDTMLTGMGARQHPLLLLITTAGDNIAGPCYDMDLTLQKVLEGTLEDDELFGIIYSIDEDDDWTSEEALRKANPNYDISVSGDFLRSRQREAMQNSRKQNIFKIKHLNMWVQARNAWMNMLAWNAQGDTTLSPEDFLGEPCWIGVDLASKLDIAAVVKIFVREIGGKDHYYLFPRFYLPETVVEDPARQHYQGWVYDGHLIATPGNMIDHPTIKRDLIDDIENYDIRCIGYDQHGATQLMQELTEDYQANCVDVPQQAKHLSEPMKSIEAFVIDKRLHHDGNPVMNWMMSNVVCRVFGDDTIFPRKEKPENKIDGPVATMIGLNRLLLDPQIPKNPYETEGLFFA
jgi:phage terminase large subunit-like protein